MKVLVSDKIADDAIKLLEDAGLEVTVKTGMPPEELEKNIPEFDAIIVRSATKVRKPIIDAGKNLKVIARAGIGLDNIDVDHARSKGITILRTPGATSISVAELAIAHMFALCRFIPQANITMRKGEWRKKEYMGTELYGKTLGLLGVGNIAKEVAERAKALGMKVIACRRSDKPLDWEDVKLGCLDDILKEADIISLHIPLIKEEAPVIGAKEFAKMKDGVILIHCARGGVVDEKALLDALNSGKVATAGIDVYEEEPTPNLELIGHPHVSVTPHIGASTAEGQVRAGVEIAQKVIAALKK